MSVRWGLTATARRALSIIRLVLEKREAQNIQKKNTESNEMPLALANVACRPVARTPSEDKFV